MKVAELNLRLELRKRARPRGGGEGFQGLEKTGGL